MSVIWETGAVRCLNEAWSVSKASHTNGCSLSSSRSGSKFCKFSKFPQRCLPTDYKRVILITNSFQKTWAACYDIWSCLTIFNRLYLADWLNSGKTLAMWPHRWNMWLAVSRAIYRALLRSADMRCDVLLTGSYAYGGSRLRAGNSQSWIIVLFSWFSL